MGDEGRKTAFYRAACWIGAEVDAPRIMPPLIPEGKLPRHGIGDGGIAPGLRCGLALGDAMRAGWTAPLAWASCDPERRRADLLMSLISLATEGGRK